MICWRQWPHVARQDSRTVVSYAAAATSLISRAELSIIKIPSNLVVFHCRLTRPRNTPLTNAVGDKSSSTRENIFWQLWERNFVASCEGLIYMEFCHCNIRKWRPFSNFSQNYENVCSRTLTSPQISFAAASRINYVWGKLTHIFYVTASSWTHLSNCHLKDLPNLVSIRLAQKFGFHEIATV